MDMDIIVVDGVWSFGTLNRFLVCQGLDSSSDVSTHTSSRKPYRKRKRSGYEQKHLLGAVLVDTINIHKKESDVAN